MRCSLLAALSLLTTTFTEPSERATAFGIFAAIAGSGASIGLLLGGALTQALSWRYCMYVNLVFAVVATAGAMVLVRNCGRSRDRGWTFPARLPSRQACSRLFTGLRTRRQRTGATN